MTKWTEFTAAALPGPCLQNCPLSFDMIFQLMQGWKQNAWPEAQLRWSLGFSRNAKNRVVPCKFSLTETEELTSSCSDVGQVFILDSRLSLKTVFPFYTFILFILFNALSWIKPIFKFCCVAHERTEEKIAGISSLKIWFPFRLFVHQM